MGRRPIFVLLVILAGTFVTAEDAPAAADLGPEAADLGPEAADLGPEAVNLDPEAADLGPEAVDLGPEAADLGPETARADGIEAELAVSSASPVLKNHLNLVDVSAGLKTPVDPNETTPAPLGDPSEAPVQQSALEPLKVPRTRAGALGIEKIKFKWTIINYNMHGMNWDEPLYSPVFSGKNTPEFQWQMQFYPRGNDKVNKAFSSLYLASVGKPGARPEVTFYLIDKNGYPASVKKVLDVNRNGEVVGFNLFVGHAYLESGDWWKTWVPDNKLTIVVEISFNPFKTGTTGQCSEFGNCLAMPYNNNERSDLHLFYTQSKNIRAQKATMAAHSTFIADKLNTSPNINAIRLPGNITSGDLQATLDAIHTGKIHPADAERIIKVADALGMRKVTEMALNAKSCT